VVHAVIKRCGP